MQKNVKFGNNKIINHTAAIYLIAKKKWRNLSLETIYLRVSYNYENPYFLTFPFNRCDCAVF